MKTIIFETIFNLGKPLANLAELEQNAAVKAIPATWQTFGLENSRKKQPKY
jgi:hypothetical protein